MRSGPRHRRRVRNAAGPRLSDRGKVPELFDAADGDPEFRTQIPAFATEIKQIFERWQLVEYLERARQTEPFDPSIYDNPKDAELERRAELRRSAADFLLMGRAKEWLLREVP